MIESLGIENLSEVYWTCFFVGFGLYLSAMLIASFIHFFKDILNSSV